MMFFLPNHKKPRHDVTARRRRPRRQEASPERRSTLYTQLSTLVNFRQPSKIQGTEFCGGGCDDSSRRRGVSSPRRFRQRTAPRTVTLFRVLLAAYFLIGMSSEHVFCHAWIRCTSSTASSNNRQQQRPFEVQQLFVASYPISSNNFTPFLGDDDDAEEKYSTKRRGNKPRGHPRRRKRRDEYSHNNVNNNKGISSISQPQRRQNNVATNNNNKFRTSNPKKKHQSSQPAYQFNTVLQSILQTTSHKRPPSWERVQEAQNLLLARVRHKTVTAPDTTSILDYDTVSFNIVMQAWARQHSMEAAQAADDLLRTLWRETNLQADSYSYAAVLHAYAKAGGQRPAALRATELLQEFLQLAATPPITTTTTTLQNNPPRTDVCHNAVMDAWAASSDVRAGQRAEQILRQLQQDPRRTATRVSYNAVIKAYAKSGQPEDAQRILDEMKQVASEGKNSHVAPDKVSLSTCMHAWAKSTQNFPLAAARADALLCEMEDAYARTGNEHLRPDVVAYSSVLAATAWSGGSAAKPLELLDRMERYGKERPNSAFLNTWIHLLSKTNETTSAASSAEVILKHMKTESAAGHEELRPCKVTYTAVVTVLAQACSVAAADRAETLLDELVNLWEQTQDDMYRPNAKTFASVLNCVSKSGATDGIERAEALMNRMESLYQRTGAVDLRPNLIVFMQVFQILARSRNPEAGSKARDVLHQMNRLHLEGHEDVRPDATTLAYFLNTLTKSGVENAVELATHIVNEAEDGYKAGIGHLKPTSLLYSAALQAYAKSASAEGARLAEELLERTKSLYREGKMYAKPTVLFYNAVIDAHARSNGGTVAAERAEALLDEMETRSRAGDPSLQPNTRSFNAAILAWKNSNSTDAPYRAEALLKRMNERYKSGDNDCRPDRVTINSIIAVWAKSSDPIGPRRAAGFLEFMESLYRQGEENFRPDQYTFNTCIDACARHGDGIGAHSLFERMQKLARKDPSLKPSLITLTSLQTAWNKSPQTREAAQHLPAIQALMAKYRRR
eukprot:scaffold294_cov221-Amphora_coffeaeformis.AAC.27